ncbi:hypothetical protein FRC09_000717 [Ceratobasidium sp. 395]|nr:hypothetical protein FRC09_000717 [Ceratobasidium sp. 395]
MLLWELANIFAACPALITLKLAELRVRDVADWIRPSPIVMKHLEVVNLTRMDPRHASSLLSLITLSGPRTELSVQISHTRELNDELASFFARSKITTLIHVTYTCEEDCDGCLTDQDCEGGIFRAAKFFPRYLPYTRTLVLENFDFYSPQVDQPAPPAPPSPLQSQLHTMFLVDCVVDFETLKRLVLEIGIQNLGLKRCTAGRPMSPNLRQELQTIQASLQEEYPHLRCWISEVDSTRQFECHTMLIPDYSFWKF